MRTALIVILALFSARAMAQVEPGNWELSLTTLLTGQEKPVAQVETRCVTEADARDPGRLLAGKGSCEFSNRRDSGGEYTFEVSCTGLLPMKGKGTMRYSPQRFDGDLDLVVVESGGGPKFGARSLVTGRRLGPC
jgi:hypothetical protein